MNAFLWTMLGFYIFDVAGRLFWLSKGRFPERTPAEVGIDAAINTSILVWVVWLLAKGGAS